MGLVDVGDMVEKYLKENGYDGLCSDDCECSCIIDDLAPCGNILIDCFAGHKIKCNCSEGCDFHIGVKDV